MKQYADLTHTLETMATLQKALDADMDLNEDEVWKNVKEALESDLGEKLPELTTLQKIKWSIIDFFEQLWWKIEFNLTPQETKQK